MTAEDRLFEQHNRGDPQALDQLIRLYYPQIFSYCCWQLASRHQGEDATQETFLRAVKYLDHYKHQGKFRAFLYKIASNVCKNYQCRPEPEGLPEDLAYEEMGFSKAEGSIDFHRQIQSLPENQREILILRFVGDFKMREIAEVTGVPLRTVQSRLRAALKQLRKKLETP